MKEKKIILKIGLFLLLTWASSLQAQVQTNATTTYDSANFPTLSPNVATPYHPFSTVTPPNNSTTAYSTLLPCPGDPSFSTSFDASCGSNCIYKSQYPDTAMCVDINNQYPVGANNSISYTTMQGGSTTTDLSYLQINQQIFCPSSCTSTLYVDNSTSPPTPHFPFCPPGYVKVADYNMQPEWKQAGSSGITIDSPISWADYQKYSATPGYTCSLDSVTAVNSVNVRSCNYANSGDYSNWRTAMTASGCTNGQPGSGGCSHGGCDVCINGNAAQYYDYGFNWGYTDSSRNSAVNSSGGWNASPVDQTSLVSGICFYCSAGLCACNNYVTTWGSNLSARFSNPGFCGSSDSLHTYWMDWGYTYYHCNVSPNTYYKTDNYVPGTYVCSHITQTWQKY